VVLRLLDFAGHFKRRSAIGISRITVVSFGNMNYMNLLSLIYVPFMTDPYPTPIQATLIHLDK
jgi:hypothetical protein